MAQRIRRTAPEAPDKIRAMIKEYDFSYVQMAAMLGMSYTNLYRILRGDVRPAYALGALVEQLEAELKATSPEQRELMHMNGVAHRVPRKE